MQSQASTSLIILRKKHVPPTLNTRVKSGMKASDSHPTQHDNRYVASQLPIKK
jgi:hypothetical protein